MTIWERINPTEWHIGWQWGFVVLAIAGAITAGAFLMPDMECH